MKDALEIGPDGDISTWPYQKLARAREHAHELISSAHAWNARNLYKCPLVLDQDQQTIRIIQIDIPNDPVSDWGLAFGDAIHNVRVALDGLTWELAHLEGNVPPNPRGVYFPISGTQRQFEDQVAKNLSHLHPNVIDRLRSLQPFMLEKPELSWLSIINKLDNDDKHRAAVSTRPTISGSSFHWGMNGHIKLGERGHGNGQVILRDSLTGVRAGETLGTITMGLEIEHLPPDAYALVSTEAMIELNDQSIPAVEVALNAASWTHSAIGEICSAVASEGGPLPIGPFQPVTES